MAVHSNSANPLLETLNLQLDQDLWLPPRPWESFSPHAPSPTFEHRRQNQHHRASSVSEASLVRLALNALLGMESAVISIQKISATFCSVPADRTFHHIPSLWSRLSSTHALGEVLGSIGCSGFLVFLLRRFVDYYTKSDLNKNPTRYDCVNFELVENLNDEGEAQREEFPPYSLVNQAFAVAIGKVLEGYICALNTLYASVAVRRLAKSDDMTRHLSSSIGCLTSVVHSEITVLEFFLHTKELRTQIEGLGNICNLYHLAACFTAYSLRGLIDKANSEFCKFPRGGELLTYLYRQLWVADPAHSALLKYLFIKACEPYCGFIRSWIYKAEICDPYGEFIVRCVHLQQSLRNGKPKNQSDNPLSSIKEQKEIVIPCFLKDFLTPLIRAGQQLKVLVKILELCNYVSMEGNTIEDFLPSWVEFSSNHLSYQSPLTFNKKNIEALVLARNSYYEKMQENLKNCLADLDVRYQQVDFGSFAKSFCDSNEGSQNIPSVHRINGDAVVQSASDEKGEDVAFDGTDSEATSRIDELSYEGDPVAFSDSSSLDTSEEYVKSEQFTDFPSSSVGIEQKYFAALTFSHSTLDDTLSHKTFHIEKSDGAGSHSFDLCHLVNSDQNQRVSGHIPTPFRSEEPTTSDIFDGNLKEGLTNFSWPLGGLLKNPFSSDGSKGEPEEEKLSYKLIKLENITIKDAPGKDHIDNETHNCPDLSMYQPWRHKYQGNFLSMNPMLTRNTFCRLISKPGDKWSSVYGETFPYYQFSFVEDPSKEFIGKYTARNVQVLGSDYMPLVDSVFAASGKSKHQNVQWYDRHDVLIGETKVPNAYSPLEIKEEGNKSIPSVNISGGSKWQSMLHGFSKNVGNNGGSRQNVLDTFEIPLDFIIDKCLLQEILLQYKYVSRLTIKLLEEGFDLHKHLLALRRYHFMEFADWADLFIMSLWHHKWHGIDGEQRASEIQALLESSVQRSSCERDCHKGRLYVYSKGHGPMPLSTSTIGVHSFDFLGLGYRVEWPISIVLTPEALKIYADIFTFLLQVKLAVFSLTDVWSHLKDFMSSISKNCPSEACEQQLHHFNILVKTRHQLNHFVSTLQQYVQSQLSNVSWCSFLQSLELKVNDMMDIETVHMAYLTDALQICFLSVEMRAVALVIENILQCTLDFRAALSADIWNVGIDKADLPGKLSRINISQVLAIQQVFDKNLKDLHLCYVKSPKHGEFSLSRFWKLLNYNECYSNLGNEFTPL